MYRLVLSLSLSFSLSRSLSFSLSLFLSLSLCICVVCTYSITTHIYAISLHMLLYKRVLLYTHTHIHPSVHTKTLYLTAHATHYGDIHRICVVYAYTSYALQTPLCTRALLYTHKRYVHASSVHTLQLHVHRTYAVDLTHMYSDICSMCGLCTR